MNMLRSYRLYCFLVMETISSLESILSVLDFSVAALEKNWSLKQYEANLVDQLILKVFYSETSIMQTPLLPSRVS